MNISIFGLGYVGCVGLACIADNGNNVIGVDINQNKIDLINSGKSTIVEDGVEEILSRNHKKGRVKATRDYIDAVKNTVVSIICVGTPSTENGHLNLNFVYRTAENIAEGLKEKSEFHIVAIRSTVLPGTNIEVTRIIEEKSGKKRGEDFAVVSNPEFLREGNAVEDYFNPPFTLIGAESEKAINIMKKLYSNINGPIEVTEIKVAEILKYVNNSFHALKISFANEVGNICKKLQIDSHEVMRLFTMDKVLNISPYYLMPGFAYGGSCLPKDLKGIKTIAHDNYLASPIINSIEESNTNQKEIAFEMVQKAGKKNVGLIGLSFKKGTDDLRYSPAVELAERLIGKGYAVSIYDNYVNLSKVTGSNKQYIDKHIPHLADLITDKIDQVISSSDVIVVTQKSDEIAEKLKETDKKIIDLARVFNRKSMGNYEGICW